MRPSKATCTDKLHAIALFAVVVGVACSEPLMAAQAPFNPFGGKRKKSSTSAGKEKPFNPFGRSKRSRYKIDGTFLMSDGTILEGPTRLRGRKVFKIYDRINMKHKELPLSAISEIVCEVGKQEYEKIWRWKEGGEHVKIDTGQSYPVLKFVHKMKLIPDEEEEEEGIVPTVEGGMSGVIFVKLSPLLNASDVRNWKRFCGKLQGQGKADEPSPGRRAWQLLPAEAKSTVERGAQGRKLTDEDHSQIVEALNVVLKDRSFYRQEDFATTTLPEVSERYLKRDPRLLSEKQYLWLNRLLLDSAYPETIRKSKVAIGGGESKLWFHETFGDKTMIGKKIEDVVYVKKMVFTEARDE